MPETLKLLGSTKGKINKDKIENVPHLENTEVALIHCNNVNNDYQQYSRISYTLVPNKSFGQLQDTLSKDFISLKNFNSDFSYIEVWLVDKNSKTKEVEDKINITLVINLSTK